MVTLTKPFYMAEIPVTQEMYEAVMGNNPSTVKDPQLPVQNPTFADVKNSAPSSRRRTRRPSAFRPMRNGNTPPAWARPTRDSRRSTRSRTAPGPKGSRRR